MAGLGVPSESKRSKSLGIAMAWLVVASVLVAVVPAATAGNPCSKEFIGSANPTADADRYVSPGPFARQAPDSGSWFAANEEFRVTLPTGTTFSGLAATDFTLQQFATVSSGACPAAAANGTATAPSSFSVTGTTVSLGVASASRSSGGSGAGYGDMVVTLQSSGANKIRLPTCPASTTDAITIWHTSAGGGTTYDTGTITLSYPALGSVAAGIPSNVHANKLALISNGIDEATVAVRALDANGVCAKNQSVTLDTTGSPVLTPSGPYTTDAQGMISFTVKCPMGQTTPMTIVVQVGSTTLTDHTVGTPPSATSGPLTFGCGEAVPSSLRFLTPPSDTGVALPFNPDVRVALYDQGGNLWTSSALPITLSLSAGGNLVNGPGQDNNQPTPPTASTSAGIAALPGTAVDTAGQYTMTAACDCPAGPISVTSLPFEVGQTGAPWPFVKRDMAHTGHVGSSARMTGIPSGTQLALANDAPLRSSPLLVDLDGDGDLDAIATNDLTDSRGGTMIVQAYRNTAGLLAPWWTFQIPPSDLLVGPPLSGVSGLAVGDLDGDGTVEVVLASSYYNDFDDGARVRVLQGDPPGGTGVVLGVVPITAGFRTHPVIADVDGTGPTAMVAHIGTGFNYWLLGIKWNGASVTTHFHSQYSDQAVVFGGIHPSPVVGEWRPGHIGREVVVVTNPMAGPGRIYFCQPTAGDVGCGTGGTATCGTGAGDCAATTTGVTGLSAADLDNDGIAEIVVNGRQNTATADALHVFRVTSGFPALVSLGSMDDSYQWNTAALGDVDNDGAADIVNVMHDEYIDTNHAGDVRVRKVVGGALVDSGRTARAAPAPIIPGPSSPGGGILVDLSGDGRAELLFGTMEEELLSFRVTDSSPANPPSQNWVVPLPSAATSPLAAADTTGDCRPEIFIGLADGTLQVFTGTAATAPAAPSFSTPADFTSPNAPDWLGGTSPGDGLRATLAWNPLPASATGGLPVVQYFIYRTTGLADGVGDNGNPYVKVGVWPSGTPPTVANPFIDDLSDSLVLGVTATEGEGDYYYKVAAVTCFTLANSGPTFAGPMSEWFHSEVRRPQAPANLVATPAVGAPPVVLTWDVPPASPGLVDRPHGCGLAASFTYNLYRRTPSTGASPIEGPPYETGLASLSYQDDSATTGNSYDYEVTAVNCIGEGPRSNLATSILGDVPGAPTSVVAKPFGDPAYAATGKGVRIDWVAATDLGDCATLTGHKVWRSPAGAGTYTQVGTAATPATAYTDTSVDVGASYDYVVLSYCASATTLESGPSVAATADVTLPANLPAPGIVPTTEPKVVITWPVPPSTNANCDWAEGYRLQRSPDGVTFADLALIQPVAWPRALPAGTALHEAPSPPAATLYEDTAVAGGTTYHYRVSAINCVGEGPMSEATTATVALPTGATINGFIDYAQTAVVGQAVALMPDMTGGVAPYTCAWSVAPAGPTLSPASTSCTAAVTFTATSPGTYVVTLQGTDSLAQVETATATLTIVPTLAVGLTPPMATGQPHTTFALMPSATGGIAPYTCQWSVTPTASGLLVPPADPCTGTAGFAEGATGETYVVTFQVTDAQGTAKSAQSTLQVIANQPPTAAFTSNPDSANVGQPVSFSDGSGDSDGQIVSYAWQFGDGHTSALSSPTHAYAAPGTYYVRLTVTDDAGATSSTTQAVTVFAATTAGQPASSAPSAGPPAGSGGAYGPMAQAGDDLVVDEGAPVRLAGSAIGASSSSLTYSWRQTDGPTVTLRDADTAAPSFVAPLASRNQSVVLRFSLVVSQAGQSSAPDFVEVTVLDVNGAPLARAGTLQRVVEGATVTLDAGGSSDPDGDKLTFHWRQVKGPHAQLSDPTAAVTAFVAPGTSMEVELKFLLEASDGTRMAADTVTVWVAPLTLPDAAFTVTPLAGRPGAYQFNAPELEGVEAEWDFGDGSAPSQDLAPLHTFAPGKYTVTLKRTGAGGASSTSQEEVTVLAADSLSGSVGGSSAAVVWAGAGLILAIAAAALVFLYMRHRSRRPQPAPAWSP